MARFWRDVPNTRSVAGNFEKEAFWVEFQDFSGLTLGFQRFSFKPNPAAYSLFRQEKGTIAKLLETFLLKRDSIVM